MAQWRPMDFGQFGKKPNYQTRYDIGGEYDGKILSSYEYGGIDPKTGKNTAWEALTKGEQDKLIREIQQGEGGLGGPLRKETPWSQGEGMMGNNIKNKIEQNYGAGMGEGGLGSIATLIYNFKGDAPVWADKPVVADVQEQEQRTTPGTEPGDKPAPETDAGAEGLGNPPDAPPDEGLQSINDWLLPGESDVTMLQGFDLFNIGEGGYTKEEVDTYNEQAANWNEWIDLNPDAAAEREMEKYDLWEFEAVESPRGSDWENLMADRIDEAKADDVVTQEEVNDIWANGIYFPDDETDDLTGFLDEQTAREQRKKAREKDGYLSMNRTYGMDLGALNLGIPGLF